MYKIIPFIKPHRKHLVKSFIYGSALDIINVAYPFLLGMLIDEVFYKKDYKFLPEIIISFIVLLLIQILFLSVQTFVGLFIYTHFMYDTKRALFEKIFRLKAGYLSSKNIGEFIVSINWDSEKLMDFLMWLTLQFTSNTLKLIVAFAVIAYTSIKIAVLSFILVPGLVILNNYISKLSKRNYEKYRVSYGRFVGWVFEIVSGLREIRLLAADRIIKTKFVSNCMGLIHLKKQTEIIEFVSTRLQSFTSLMFDLIFYVSAVILINNCELTIGKFVAVLGYLGIVKLSIMFFFDSKVRLQGNMVSIDRMIELLEEDGEEDSGNKEELANIKGDLIFTNISFRYGDGGYVLKGLDLNIREGEKIAIVGRSGAGKSTVLNLLLRFYDSYSGTIEISGKDIREYTIKSIRRNIGIIQQDSFLFPGTIRYNLELGNHNFTEKDIWNACEKARISDFLRSLPDGLDTVIGNGGINLSGGQKQRLVIARIFIKNPQIIILDEATSALDYEVEKEVQNAFKDVCKGRTVIIIAHRLSSFRDSDRVAVLEEGRIVSIGHHFELLESCPSYRSLFEKQCISHEIL